MATPLSKSSLAAINEVVKKTIMPRVTQDIFRQSPLLAYVKGLKPQYSFRFRVHQLFGSALEWGYEGRMYKR